MNSNVLEYVKGKRREFLILLYEYTVLVQQKLLGRAHTYSHIRAHSPNFPSLHLRHNLFSNPSVALPTSQLILQPSRCFTYVTAHSPTLLSLFLRHKLFT